MRADFADDCPLDRRQHFSTAHILYTKQRARITTMSTNKEKEKKKKIKWKVT